MYDQRWRLAVFQRLGGFDDEVGLALSLGYTGLSQINGVRQTADFAASASGEALAQSMAKGASHEGRIAALERMVDFLNTALRVTQQQQRQAVIQSRNFQFSVERTQVAETQRFNSKAKFLEDEIETVTSGFAVKVWGALAVTGSGLSFNNSTGIFSLDATLQGLSTVTTAADKLIYATGADTFATTDLTSFGRSLLDDADAAAGRNTLGLGNVENKSSATIRAEVLAAANTFEALQTMMRYNTTGGLVLQRANGASGSPTAVGSGESVSIISCRGYDGSAYRSVVNITAATSGAVTGTNSSGLLTISTTPPGSTTPVDRVRILDDGTVQMVALAADPASPVDGAIWPNGTTGKLRFRINGVTYDLN